MRKIYWRSPMQKKTLVSALATAVFSLATANSWAMDKQADATYQEHCAVCHGAQRIGGLGPALLPESLGRIKKKGALEVIANGRPASQMIGYQDIFSEQQLNQLVDYLFTPADNPPSWTIADTKASHRLFVDQSSLPSTPQHNSDPLNLFVVVEAGDHHVTILDGDKFEAIDR